MTIGIRERPSPRARGKEFANKRPVLLRFGKPASANEVVRFQTRGVLLPTQKPQI